MNPDRQTEIKDLYTRLNHTEDMSQNTSVEKEIAKVAIGFKALQSGLVSTMSEEDFQKFLKWLDGEVA